MLVNPVLTCVQLSPLSVERNNVIPVTASKKLRRQKWPAAR